MMNTIPIAAIIIMLMSGMACAELEYDWAHERRNVAPENISYVYYDFEEGSNCAPFNNQYPDVATFLTVLGTRPYGSDEPSYSTVGGSTCGNTRCYMNIYPYPNQQDWIYIVNGRAGFNPITGPDHIGGYYPGTRAHIVFKEDTHYISFLASTGGDLSVRLYDRRGNTIHYDKIACTIFRNGTHPSNFTRFSAHIPETDIVVMKLYGGFNAWHIDDLIIGGGPSYLPDMPVDYTYVARRAQELHGVDYLEHGLGADYEVFDYLDTWQFIDSALEEYWNPETKRFELGEGISNAGLIVWAYNYDSMELMGEHIIKWSTVAGMEKHDFKADVDPSDIIPGDVGFKDRDYDGYADEAYMVIEPTDTGMDLITSCPDESIGVIYSKSSIVEGSPAFMGYKRLPVAINGGHNPIPKGH